MALGAQAAVAIENARLFLQSDLIAEMVHEIRTPLASLTTATHLLTRDDVPIEQRRRISEVIYIETNRLTDMTSAFLDLARLESGRTQFNPVQVDVHKLLEESVGVIRDKAVENKQKLNLELPAKLPPLKADRDKIKQVILNLLSNAIKYNRPGGNITLTCRVEDNDLVITVSDTGVGIKEEDLGRLFDKFYRVRSIENVIRGTGLGLAISKRIVEAHGGRVKVKSQIGVGSSFSIYLPLKSA